MPIPKHLISSEDIDKAGYDEILRRTEKFLAEGIPPHLMEGKVLATLFFQPSTRTRASFQSAIIRSGGGWIGTTEASTTSIAKGESFEDTVRTYSGYADLILLRHAQPDATEIGAKVSEVPVINGGNGNKEHAVAGGMLLHHMKHYLGQLEGKTMGIYGPAGFSRATKALIKIVGHYGMKIFIDDVDGLFPLPKEIIDKAMENGLTEIKHEKLDNFIDKVDWLFVTNAIPTASTNTDLEQMLIEHFKPISVETMKKLRKDAFLDMVTPCVIEVEKDVYPDPRTVFTKKESQAEYALALMTYLLDVKVD